MAEDVHIVWQGPLSEMQVKKMRDPGRDRGIYAVYGPHNTFGRPTLLLIGKAETSFGECIPGLNWPGGLLKSEIQFHVGRFVCRQFDAPPDLELVETVLTYVHGPGHHALPQGPAPWALRIFNWGNYRSLLPEVSGRRWLACPQEVFAELEQQEPPSSRRRPQTPARRGRAQEPRSSNVRNGKGGGTRS